MRLDCGIDIGTTNLKVVLIDEEGRAVFMRSVPTPRRSDGVGTVTDADTLTSVLEDMIIEGWRRHGRSVALRSITTAGIGEDGIGVGADLAPTGLAIPWFDTRANSEVPALQALGVDPRRTGIVIAADRTVAKWAWLRRHRPSELDGAAHWIALTDYPAVRWSGIPFMSLSLAPRTACFDISNGRWEEALLERVGAPTLPPVLPAGTAIGGVRSGALIEAGAASPATIIAVGGHDHPVAASLFMRHDPLARVDSLGTANLLYGERPGGDGRMAPEGIALSLPPAGGGRQACLGVIALAAALADESRDEALFRSFLAKTPLPGEPPADMAALIAGDDTAPPARRSLERTAIEASMMLDGMTAMGVRPGDIYTSGGWTRSHGFVALRASVFGCPIHAVADLETTAIGAAVFGAMAAGASVNPLRARDITTIEPVPDWAERYQALRATHSETRRRPEGHA